MVLKPARVPISSTLRAPDDLTSSFSSFPAFGVTSIGGIPASSADLTARWTRIVGMDDDVGQELFYGHPLGPRLVLKHGPSLPASARPG